MQEAELEKIRAEISKVMAESLRIGAEAGKITRETFWYPVTVAIAMFGAGVAFAKLFF